MMFIYLVLAIVLVFVVIDRKDSIMKKRSDMIESKISKETSREE